MPESSLRQSRDHPYHKDRFAYDESNDSFMCPQGKVLPFERIHIPPNGVRYRFYRAPGAVCRACPAFGVCTKSKDGQNVTVGPYDAALRRHRAWMTTSAATEVYKLRKQMVEPVFGIIKEQQAGRRFLLRGLINVAAEWTVLATAFNLRTLPMSFPTFGDVIAVRNAPFLKVFTLLRPVEGRFTPVSATNSHLSPFCSQTQTPVHPQYCAEEAEKRRA